MMKTRAVARILAVALVGALLLPAVPGVAHQFAAPSTISIKRRPRGTVNPGTLVKFFGRVTSPQVECKGGRTVRLFRGNIVVATDITSPRGKYRFRQQVPATSRWHTRVDPSVGGLHPHRHICLGDRSPTVRVRVG